ncbi:MAG: hypothetical protein ACOCRX_10725 [Candidatus Woesearchaeota archaeon]
MKYNIGDEITWTPIFNSKISLKAVSGVVIDILKGRFNNKLILMTDKGDVRAVWDNKGTIAVKKVQKNI